MSHTLYQFPGNPRGNVCRIVADMAGVPVNFVWTDFAGTKAPEYLAKHSLGRIPFLETPQGTLFETNTILRYFARISTKRQNLLGKTSFE
jgi:elongation factor 1-gamma